MIQLVGDLSIILACIAIAAIILIAGRGLIRANHGLTLIGFALIGIGASAGVKAAGEGPGAADAVTALAYGGYAVSFGLLTIGILRWLPLLRQLDAEIGARAAAEESLGRALDRARTYNKGLETLARAHIEGQWDLQRLMQETTVQLSKLLDAQRVSVWRLDDAGRALDCLCLFDAETEEHSGGARILRATNPSYFEALEAGGAIVIDDAINDPLTSAFAPDYLRPLNIGAMLDAPIRTGAGVRGVVCCEHVGGVRLWNAEEIALAASAAQYVAVAYLAENAESLASKVQSALKQAQAASNSKSAFIANASHELRTPLNGVLGMAESLADSALSPAQQAQAETIVASGRQLLGVLNDILDLSKIEAGHFDITPETVDLAELIASTTALFESAAGRKGLTLDHCIDAAPDRVLADPLRVRQCLSNLIGNAVKFTETGSICVSGAAHAVDDGAAWRIAISVRDTGCGVADSDRAQLFERFAQGDGASGSGLGLSIAREIARRMGGDVTLDDADETGSQFTFSFIARTAQAPARAPADAESIAGATAGSDLAPLQRARILLVDDNEVNRVVARCFLEPAGACIVEAESGQAALDLFAEQPFDLILLDAHMPQMSGEETLKRLRSASPEGAAVPVIALTADAMVGDEGRYRAMGMDGYVPKPVDKQDLLGACAALIANPPERDATRAAG